MKCSIGVTISSLILLIASAFALFAAAGTAFMFLGPMSAQFFDPANLPPGADVRMMRAAGIGGALFMTVLGAAGVTTGIGLMRLWRWARYAAITFGALTVFFSVTSGAVLLFLPMPAPPPDAGTPPQVMAGVRTAIVVFYAAWALVGAWFVFFFVRKETAVQFNGTGEPPRRVRPVSITVIAWLMILSGAMMVPTLAFLTMPHMPAMFLGIIIAGPAAKLFYIAYGLVYLSIGIVLITNTARALTPAIAIHILGAFNALTMLVPSIWARYQDAMGAMSPLFAAQPTMRWAQYSAAASGVAFAGLIVYFLVAARRTMARMDADSYPNG